MHERKTVREKGWMVGEKEEEGERGREKLEDYAQDHGTP